MQCKNQVLFSIPFMSRGGENEWSKACGQLSQTLKSVVNQTNSNFTAIVCSHDRPSIPELQHPNVIFVESTAKRISSAADGAADKGRKRRQTFSVAADLGGGYVFMLDADDLISSRSVDYMLKTNDDNGYIFPLGYCLDDASGKVAPIPGVWRKQFYEVNGSCAAIKCSADDLVSSNEIPAYINNFKQHSGWAKVAEEAGRPLHRVPFPVAIYRVNTETSLHVMSESRSQDRVNEIVSAISQQALSRSEVFDNEFSLL